MCHFYSHRNPAAPTIAHLAEALALTAVQLMSFMMIKTVGLCSCNAEVVQLDATELHLAISTRVQCFLLDFEREKLFKVGSKPRDGVFGVCFHPEKEELLLAARPAKNLWDVSLLTGEVLSTRKYQQSFKLVRTTRLLSAVCPLPAPKVKLGSVQFGRLHCLGSLVLSWSADTLVLLDPLQSGVLQWHKDVATLLQAAVVGNCAYLLLAADGAKPEVVEVEALAPTAFARRMAADALALGQVDGQRLPCLALAAGLVLQRGIEDRPLLLRLLEAIPEEATVEGEEGAEAEPLQPLRSAMEAVLERMRQKELEAEEEARRREEERRQEEERRKEEARRQEEERLRLAEEKRIQEEQEREQQRLAAEEAKRLAEEERERQRLIKEQKALERQKRKQEREKLEREQRERQLKLEREEMLRQMKSSLLNSDSSTPEPLAPPPLSTPVASASVALGEGLEAANETATAVEAKSEESSEQEDVPAAVVATPVKAAKKARKVKRKRAKRVATIAPASAKPAILAPPPAEEESLAEASPAAEADAAADSSLPDLLAELTGASAAGGEKDRSDSSLPTVDELLDSSAAPQGQEAAKALPQEATEAPEREEGNGAVAEPSQGTGEAPASPTESIKESGAAAREEDSPPAVAATAGEQKAAHSTHTTGQRARGASAVAPLEVSAAPDSHFDSSAPKHELSAEIFGLLSRAGDKSTVDASLLARWLAETAVGPVNARRHWLVEIVSHCLEQGITGPEGEGCEEEEERALAFLRARAAEVDLRRAFLHCNGRRWRRCVAFLLQVERTPGLMQTAERRARAQVLRQLEQLVREEDTSAALALLRAQADAGLNVRFVEPLLALHPFSTTDYCASAYPQVLPWNLSLLLEDGAAFAGCAAEKRQELHTAVLQYLLAMLFREEACRADASLVHAVVRQCLAFGAPARGLLVASAVEAGEELPRAGALLHARWPFAESVVGIVRHPARFAYEFGEVERACSEAGHFAALLELFRVHGFLLRGVELSMRLDDLASFEALAPLMLAEHEWQFTLEKWVEVQEVRAGQRQRQSLRGGGGGGAAEEAALQVTREVLVRHMVPCVGSLAAVSCLEACHQFAGELPPSLYSDLIRGSRIAMQQEELIPKMVDVTSQYLWKTRGSSLSDQLLHVRDLEQGNDGTSKLASAHDRFPAAERLRLPEAALIDRTVGHEAWLEASAGQWGSFSRLVRGDCPTCTLPLRLFVSPSVTVFRCGHGFHRHCVPENACRLCFSLPSLLDL